MTDEKKIEFDKNMNAVRGEIDSIDSQLIPLLIERMKCSARVAEYKRKADMPVYDPIREKHILDNIRSSDEEYGSSLSSIYTGIMAASKAKQYAMLDSRGEAIRQIEKNAPREMPAKNVKIVCQGKEGAYSHKSARSFFPGNENISFTESFSQVFQEVAGRKADYGILPVENSVAGSVAEVYNLLLKHRCFIVGANVVKINHCLAAIGKTPVHTVMSHPQALRQCSDYISSHNLKEIEYSNTAAAAEMLKESGDPGLGVICSVEAAKSRGLTIIAENIQNAAHNATRFIVISKEAILPEKADKISLCFSLPHRTGSLYNILESFAFHGLNLTKIESVPIPERQFEYDFYLDFTGNIHDEKTLGLICALHDELSRFSFLGNYIVQDAE